MSAPAHSLQTRRKRTRSRHPRTLDAIVRGDRPDESVRVRGCNQQHLLERERELSRRVRAFLADGGVLTSQNVYAVMAHVSAGLPWSAEFPLQPLSAVPAAKIESLLAYARTCRLSGNNQPPVR